MQEQLKWQEILVKVYKTDDSFMIVAPSINPGRKRTWQQL
jgi:hypothetical protein